MTILSYLFLSFSLFDLPLFLESHFYFSVSRLNCCFSSQDTNESTIHSHFDFQNVFSIPPMRNPWGFASSSDSFKFSLFKSELWIESWSIESLFHFFPTKRSFVSFPVWGSSKFSASETSSSPSSSKISSSPLSSSNSSSSPSIS